MTRSGKAFRREDKARKAREASEAQASEDKRLAFLAANGIKVITTNPSAILARNVKGLILSR